MVERHLAGLCLLALLLAACGREGGASSEPTGEFTFCDRTVAAPTAPDPRVSVGIELLQERIRAGDPLDIVVSAVNDGDTAIPWYHGWSPTEVWVSGPTGEVVWLASTDEPLTPGGGRSIPGILKVDEFAPGSRAVAEVQWKGGGCNGEHVDLEPGTYTARATIYGGPDGETPIDEYSWWADPVLFEITD